jgi:Purple acid Phosphatase, N-terminal domain
MRQSGKTMAVSVLLMVSALGAWALSSQPATDDPDLKPVQITNGPVVENVTDTTAVIAWSTNVNSGTVLLYGTDPRRLDQTASMPWGGLTHRVNLKDLTPDTTYYYLAQSPKAQGTGTMAQSSLESFKTKSGQACITACT